MYRGEKSSLLHFGHFSLSHNEPVVYSLFLDKLIVSSDLSNSSLIKHDKSRSVTQGGKSVRDGYCRSVL